MATKRHVKYWKTAGEERNTVTSNIIVLYGDSRYRKTTRDALSNFLSHSRFYRVGWGSWEEWFLSFDV